MGRHYQANIGKAVAIVLDGLVYTSPRINSEIDGGQSSISGSFTVEDTKDLANTLKSGRMPAPAKIVQEEVVGPTLVRSLSSRVLYLSPSHSYS